MLISTVFRKLKRLPVRRRGVISGRRSQSRAASPSEILEQRQMLDATLPQLVGDSYSFRSNGSTKQLDVLANDTPGDSGTLEIESVSQGDHGGFVQIAPDGQSLIYRPFAGAHGVETFHYAVTGGMTAEVTVRLRDPVEDDRYQVYEQTGTIRLDVMANDDLGSRFTGARRITALSLTSSGGTVEIAEDGVSLWYTPNPDVFDGVDRFEYVVGDQLSGTVSVRVVPLLRRDEFGNYLEDGRVYAGIPRTLDVLANDPFHIDYAGERQVTLITDPVHGTVELSPDGQSIVYTADAGYSGGDTFYYVVDGRYEARVSVQVTKLTSPDSIAVLPDSSEVSVRVLSNDLHLSVLGSSDAISITEVTQPTEGGSLTVSEDGQSLIYTPASSFEGNETATYTVNGSHQETVTFRVWQPQAVIGVNRQLTIHQEQKNVPLFVMAHSYFASYMGARVITEFSQGEQGGTVVLDANGTDLLYTPDPDFVGRDEVTFTIDGIISGSAIITVRSLAAGESINKVISPAFDEITLNVLANEHRIADPIITAIDVDEDAPVDVRVSDDGQLILLTPQEMQFRTVTVRYTINGRYETQANVRLYPSIELHDDQSSALQNGAGTVIDPLANDEFGDAASSIFDWLAGHYVDSEFPYTGNMEITSVGPAEHGGTVTISQDGQRLIYEPAPDFTGTDTFEYVVDGQWAGGVRVEVHRAVRDDTASVLAGSVDHPISVLSNDPLDTDYSGPGVITDVAQPASGATVRIADDGTRVLYTPDDGFTGEDSFTYRVDGTQVATVTVQVGNSIDDLLDRFSSMDEIRDWLLEDALRRYGGRFGREYADTGVVIGLDGTLASTALGTADNAVYSETNVQVAGVDEADLVENDGEHLYVLSGSDLIIVRAWPADELAEVARLHIPGAPKGMYLHDGRLTVISETVSYGNVVRVIVPWGGTIDDASLSTDAVALGVASDSIDPVSQIDSLWRYYPRPAAIRNTVVTVLDVSQPDDPQLIRETTINAAYRDSRSIDGTLQLLTERSNRDLRLPEPELVDAENSAEPVTAGNEYSVIFNDGDALTGITDARYETEEEYIARITATLDELVKELFPYYETLEADGTVTSGTLLNPTEFVRLSESGTTVLSIVSLKTDSDLAAPIAAETLLTSRTSTVYATRDHLYVLGVAPASETGIVRSEDGYATQIRRFSWDSEAGGIELTAVGAVPGQPTDEFALDEFGGRLRVATSVNRSTVTGHRGVTDLYVLDADSFVLQTVGALLDVGRGEELQAIRYHGDLAVATTYDSSSPLRVIDLSDATQPELAGSIRSIGRPSYMQFVDDTHLLTIGRDSVTGFNGPTLVSLFDLTAPENPTLQDQDALPRFSTSTAESDHHAFGWFAHHGVLAIPSSRSFSARVDNDGDGFRETREARREDTLFTFEVDTSFSGRSEDALQLLGQVEHEQAILRSAFIGDVLYSVGNGLIKAVDIRNPSSEIATAALDFSPVEIQRSLSWFQVTIDASEFQWAAIQADAIASPVATIEIVNRVLEIDLTDVPDADAVVVRDKQAGELVVRYRSTSLETELTEQRFALQDVGKLRVTLGSGDDQLDLSRAFRQSTVFGGAGNDSLIGGARYDELHGQAGDDVLQGRNGVDLLFGEDGNDLLLGQQYNDWMYGGNGDDTLLGRNGDDVLHGGSGADFLNGGRGRNRLTDQVDGNVTLAANGYDTGRGDVARAIGPRGRLEIIGGDGHDRIDASSYSGGGIVLNGGGGNDTLIGSRGDDSLDGDTGDDVIHGGAGRDTLFGADGNDRLLGQGGIDELGGGLGDDRIDGGGSVSIIREQADADYSLSGDRHGVSTEGIGNDRWIGTYVKAVLAGGESDNVIDASEFAERTVVYGLAGNDVLAIRSIQSRAVGGDGEDVIVTGGGPGEELLAWHETVPAAEASSSLTTVVNSGQNGTLEPDQTTAGNGSGPAARFGQVTLDQLVRAYAEIAARSGGSLDDVVLYGFDRHVCSGGPAVLCAPPGTHVEFTANGRAYRYHAYEPQGFADFNERSDLSIRDWDAPSSQVHAVDAAISDAMRRLAGLGQ